MNIERKIRQETVRAVADYLRTWDKPCAVGTNGYRLSDIVLCKFNVTKRKKPRKVKV
jgi:hypothetical protein